MTLFQGIILLVLCNGEDSVSTSITYPSLHAPYTTMLLANTAAFLCQDHCNLHNIKVVYFPRLPDSQIA